MKEPKTSEPTVKEYLLKNGYDYFADQINNLTTLCHSLSREAGWHDKPREVGTMIALIHSEVSEALEGFRKDLNDDHLPDRKMAEVEMADTIIRICDLAGLLQMDLGGALIDKLKYNTSRKDFTKAHRSSKHGKKF